MTSFDGLVIAVLILSTGFAIVRGALREIGTLAALGAGAFAAFLLVKPLQAAIGIDQSFMATLIVGAVLLAAGFVLAYALLQVGLKRARMTGRALTVDRVGGGVFGFLRGLVLVGLGFLAYSYYLDETRRPESVNKALTLPVAKAMAAIFEGFAPQEKEIEPAQPEEQDSNAAVEGYARTDRTALAEIVTTVTTSDNPEAKDADGAASGDPIADILTESDPE